MHFTKKKSNKINAAHDKCEKKGKSFLKFVYAKDNDQKDIFTQ